VRAQLDLLVLFLPPSPPLSRGKQLWDEGGLEGFLTVATNVCATLVRAFELGRGHQGLSSFM
jgi:hypothetical protein